MPSPDEKYVYILGHHYGTHLVIIRRLDNKVIGRASTDRYSPPDRVAITPDGKYLYAIGREGCISIIRTSDGQVVDTIYMKGPITDIDGTYIVIDPTGKYVYVPYEDVLENTKKVAVIGTSGKALPNTILKMIPIRGPGGIAITPDEKYIYVAQVEDNKVAVIRTSDNKIVDSKYVLKAPCYIAMTPNGKYAYVTHLKDNRVLVIRTSDNKIVDSIDVGGPSYGIAITPDGKYAYVTKPIAHNVSIIKTADNKVLDTISVAKFPMGIAITPDGKYVYVAGSGGYKGEREEGTVTVIRTQDKKVLQMLPVEGASNIVITPDGKYAYVAGYGIWIIRTADNTIIEKRIGPETWIGSITITRDGDYVYTYWEGRITVRRASDNKIVDKISSPDFAQYGGAYLTPGPKGNYIYGSTHDGNKVFIIKSASSKEKMEKTALFKKGESIAKKEKEVPSGKKPQISLYILYWKQRPTSFLLEKISEM